MFPEFYRSCDGGLSYGNGILQSVGSATGLMALATNPTKQCPGKDLPANYRLRHCNCLAKRI
jgi:hypothetical protein